MEQLAATVQRARSAICSDDKQRNRYGAEPPTRSRCSAWQPLNKPFKSQSEEVRENNRVVHLHKPNLFFLLLFLWGVFS